jgi:hypothetical protein
MDVLASLFRNDQIGLAQQIEVVGNARKAHDKVLADFAHAQFSFPQEFQNAAACRVIQGAEKLGHDI